MRHPLILRTLGIIDTDQAITAEAMKAYDDVFAAPIPLVVLTAIAALELPAHLLTPNGSATPDGRPVVV